ncbi:alanine racemase 1-like [Haliotis rubra]|uniref:alanine racemase 1-like n=1 Tax=Haliotis rubra TaxID=36100 RepID=UPI001EE53F62|nr:alanine racemase 1-like [Haliotis rubra]
MEPPPPDAELYPRAGRSTFLRIRLDVLFNNISILKQRCSAHTDIIAVVKANAYGHGSVEISRYLESRGVGHFAVAIPEEGAQLRQAGIQGHILILGNAIEEDIPILVKYTLTPTVAELKFLKEWCKATTKDPKRGKEWSPTSACWESVHGRHHSPLDEPKPSSTTFNIITDDFTSPNSVTKMAATRQNPHEVTTSLAARLPRVFCLADML